MISDLVSETTTGTGTGNLTLAAALLSFSAIFGTGSGNTFYYAIFNEDASEWERGVGYMDDATTLVRNTILASSNSNNAVDFSAGTKKVVNDSPAEFQKHGAIPIRSISAAETLVMTDAGRTILHPAADTTARTFTIPANSSVPYPIGTAITFVNQNGAGVVTIAITTDTMRLAGSGATGNRTLAANGMATALKITSTEWIINGTGIS
jgi:hypothetical protein